MKRPITLRSIKQRLKRKEKKSELKLKYYTKRNFFVPRNLLPVSLYFSYSICIELNSRNKGEQIKQIKKSVADIHRHLKQGGAGGTEQELKRIEGTLEHIES